MLCTYVRSSSYNQYNYCQMSYFITYNLGFNPPSGKRADIGTIVHKVMEMLARFKKEIQDNPKAKKIELLDDALGTVSTTKSNFLKESIVSDLLDASFDYYTKRSSHNTFSKKDKDECLAMCWSALNYNDGQFDPRNRNIVAAEPHFDIPIEEDWAHYEFELPSGEKIKGQLAIKGTIDLVTESADGVIEVIDWKTGRRLDWATGEEKTYEKLCSDPQLLLYNYAISKLFPEYKQSIMSIFFIKDGGPFSMCFDKEEHAKFLDMLKDKFEDIKKNNRPKPLSQSRDSWKCTKLCHYYKNNWPDSDKNICQYVDDHIQLYGIDSTVKKCTKDGFDIGYYSAPG